MTTTELIANLKTSRAKMLRSDDPKRKADGEVEILLSTDHVIEHLERLEAENAALRADAERYRWLRSHSNLEVGDFEVIKDGSQYWRGDDLDAAIDAALSVRPPSEEKR